MLKFQCAAILADGADCAFVKAFRSFGMDFKRDLNLASNLTRLGDLVFLGSTLKEKMRGITLFSLWLE